MSVQYWNARMVHVVNYIRVYNGVSIRVGVSYLEYVSIYIYNCNKVVGIECWSPMSYYRMG